ncbi:MAG TPA: outer membrane protein transport protein [Stellaceae bacterium]|nr:outer membrane protein transport protein [Stellaceae bacterium]
MKPAVVCGVALGLSTVAAATNAWGSAFALRENSAEEVGTAGAGAGSRATDLDTVYNNPAGMTRLDGTQIEFGAAVPTTSIDFHGTATLAGTQISGNQGSAGRTAIVPNFYFSTPLTRFGLSDDWRAGVAITSPFGTAVKYDSPWIGRYLGVASSIISINVNPVIAYRVNSWLSIGGGPDIQYFKANVFNNINQSAILGIPGVGDATARLVSDDQSVGYNVGILLEPLEGSRIGLTYRSGINHNTHGTFNFSDVSPFLAGALVSSQFANADFKLPATAGFSFTQQVTPRLSLSTDVQWTNWSVFKEVDITDTPTGTVLDPNPENYKNTWFVAFGGVYNLTDQVTLRAGAAWDQSPITNHWRTVFLPDQDRYTIGVGLGYKFNPAISADLAYAHYFAAPASMNESFNRFDHVTGSVLQGVYNVAIDYAALSFRVHF